MSPLQPELLHLTSGDEKYLETNTKRQYYAALMMSLLSFGYGACCGWPSAAVLLLTSEYDTPLETGPISSNDIGWIASAVGIGGFIGNLFFGWVNYLKKNLLKNFTFFSFLKSFQKNLEEKIRSTALPCQAYSVGY